MGLQVTEGIARQGELLLQLLIDGDSPAETVVQILSEVALTVSDHLGGEVCGLAGKVQRDLSQGGHGVGPGLQTALFCEGGGVVARRPKPAVAGPYPKQGTEQADQPPAQLMRAWSRTASTVPRMRQRAQAVRKTVTSTSAREKGERGRQAAQKLLRRCHDMDDPAVHQGLTAPKQVEEKREQDRGEQG